MKDGCDSLDGVGIRDGGGEPLLEAGRDEPGDVVRRVASVVWRRLGAAPLVFGGRHRRAHVPAAALSRLTSWAGISVRVSIRMTWTRPE
jgi:hypothetical protein